MTLLIQDTARNNLVAWTLRSVQAGRARGAVVSPFASPVRGNGYKQDITTTAERLRQGGAELWFDATTHALQMAGVGDFRYYEQWDLWQESQGDLSTQAACRDHVMRVFAIQDRLGAPHLAPTLLLNTPQSPSSELALRLARIAAEEDPQAWLSLAGDIHFWRGEDDLDAHIGALAQIPCSGFFLTVVRTHSVLPVQASALEIFGLARTARSLSEDVQVHVGHGDLAALVAVAAGATSVGTGWDPRQRVCSYADHAPRDAASDGGQWYQRPTLLGLVGSLKTNEYELLRGQAPAFAESLLPGTLAPGAEESFGQHSTALANLIDELSVLDRAASADRLDDIYRAAEQNWAGVRAITNCEAAADEWIAPFRQGLQFYRTEEGW